MARSKTRWKLTDEQWKKIEPLLPKPKTSRRGGRPWADNRNVFEGILWILRTGAPWADLPKRYSSPSTCWRRLRQWEEQGVWLKIWRAFLAELDEQGQWDWAEAFVDGSFAPAKKRRKDPKGQRNEVDGGGRRSRCSFGSLPGRGVPERSQARGKSDSRHRGTATRAGSATHETEAVDC